jgi:hypothetical protein
MIWRACDEDLRNHVYEMAGAPAIEARAVRIG